MLRPTPATESSLGLLLVGDDLSLVTYPRRYEDEILIEAMESCALLARGDRFDKVDSCLTDRGHPAVNGFSTSRLRRTHELATL